MNGFEWSKDIAHSADDYYEDPSAILPWIEPVPAPVPVSGPKSATPVSRLEKGLQRHKVRGEADLRAQTGRMVQMTCKVRDISVRGFFALTDIPIPLQTTLLIRLRIDGLDLEGQGAVRTTDNMGMWVDFTHLASNQRVLLQHFVEGLPD